MITARILHETTEAVLQVSEHGLRPGTYGVVDSGCTFACGGEETLNQYQIESFAATKRCVEVDVSNRRSFKYADMKTHRSLSLATLPMILSRRLGTLRISL